jgi:DNA-binding protein HU-beta
MSEQFAVTHWNKNWNAGEGNQEIGFHHLTLRRKRMTKADLVAEIASEGGITGSQAEKAVDGFVSAVSATLSGGDKLTLVGLGTFSVGTRSQREGYNPRTGEKI